MLDGNAMRYRMQMFQELAYDYEDELEKARNGSGLCHVIRKKDGFVFVLMMTRDVVTMVFVMPAEPGGLEDVQLETTCCRNQETGEDEPNDALCRSELRSKLAEWLINHAK